VITGLGAITALGEGAQALWQAAVQGRSGIDFLDYPSLSGSWRVPAAVVRDFCPEKYVTQRKALKVMARDIQLAVAGASLALDDSGVHSFAYDRERFGLIVGSGVLNHELDEMANSIQSSLDENGKLDMKKFGDDGLSALFPLWLLKYLPNMSACHISVLFDLQGLNNTITTGASAGLQAVGEAFRIIQRDDADLMLAGGAESKVNPVGIAQYKILGALSGSSSDDAKNDYRPLDERSQGFVVGEGAGFLLLEELEHAKKRGAKIYAELVGYGSSSRNGRTTAMEAALKDAGVRASDLRYLQAAGLGLKEEDRQEQQAIYDVFNGAGKNLSVSASKALTGFTGFSAGALDLILSAIALERQTIPPAFNFSKAEKDWGFQIVKDKALQKQIPYAMTNASGFNGQAVSVVTKAVGEK
jgi:3-oxoacyl-[acyl-carrier-protein] synthase II